MSNENGKLKESKKQHVQERIVIALYGINYLTSQLNTVITQKRFVDSDVIQEATDRDEEFREEIATDLANILEKVGDYTDGMDITFPEDVALMNPIFNALHQE